MHDRGQRSRPFQYFDHMRIISQTYINYIFEKKTLTYFELALISKYYILGVFIRTVKTFEIYFNLRFHDSILL